MIWSQIFIFVDKAEKDGQVFVKVQTDAILPCEIDIQSDNQTFLTYTWTQGSVFLFTAKKVQENVTLTYLTDSLKTKYSLADEFSLKIKDVELTDTGLYTCTVGVYRDPDTIDLVYKLNNTTQLFVQGKLKQNQYLISYFHLEFYMHVGHEV